MDLGRILQAVVDSLSLGSLFALYGLGVALVFGIMRLVNFAHGELIMVGAYALVLTTDIPLAVRLLVVGGVTVLLALSMERVAFRPMRGADPATLLTASFALSFLLQNVAILVFGATPRSADVSPVFRESFSVATITISYVNLVTIAVTIALLVGLALFLARTRVGLYMRASAEDFQMARVLGVKANTVIAAAFALGGVLAAAGSVLFVAQTGTVSPAMGLVPILFGFIATVVGGLGSLAGAVAGGYLLGVLSAFLQLMLPLELRPYRDAFVFAAVAALMVIRPQGLIVARSARGERI